MEPVSYTHLQGLDKESDLIVAKLTAILRLANSLDRSHKQKMKGVKATLQDNEPVSYTHLDVYKRQQGERR